MKKLFITVAVLVASFIQAQTNTLMDAGFWKKNPTIETVKAEINKGNSPSQQNGGFFDPVVIAINNNANTDVIKFLIEQEGNSVDKKTHHSRTYLQWAAAQGNLDIVNFLIAKGSDVNYKDSHGDNVITYAATSGNKNLAVYDTLIKAGANPKIKNENGTNIIMEAIANDNDLKVTEYFVSKGISLTDKDNFGRTVADYSTKLGNLTILDKLIAKGVKPTDQALFFATQGSRMKENGVEVFQELVNKYKLNPKAINPEGQTLLHALSRRGNLETINYILSQGADTKVVDKAGNTALMIASAGKNAELVQLFLDKTNNINTVNLNGESALTNAVASGSPQIVTLLLEKGAKANIVDKQGNNLAYYWLNSIRPQGPQGAPQNNSKDEDQKQTLLTNAKVDFKATQNKGATLLHLAVDKGNVALVKKAIDLGVNVNAQDEDGNTALHKAALVAKNDAILKTLIEAGAKKDIKTEFDETAYELAFQNEFLKNNNVSIEFLK
jgi:uncharacterized protein